MKGYKATIKGKCRNQIYEVGKTYKIEGAEIKLCELGFHFCKEPNDVFNYYKSTKKNLVVYEVEAIGDIKSSSDTLVTDELKVIREIPKHEYNSIFTNCEFKFDSNDNLVWEKDSYGYTHEYRYDSNDNLIWEKSSNGYIWEYKYDSNNNIIWTKDSFCNIWDYKYDSNNNKILEKTPNCIHEYPSYKVTCY